MSNRVKLEVDPSIIADNLDFGISDGNNDLWKGILGSPNDTSQHEIPWKFVMPMPGFVIKCHTLEGDKIFLNVCHCTEIPAPEDITEEELMTLMESEDDITFVVPMSISDLHVECDKSGNLASAYDIAINFDFFIKIEKSSLFRQFFISVILQGVEDKYKLQFDRDKDLTILKNRKCFGKLQSHRVQQRPVRSAPKTLIDELPNNLLSSVQNTTTRKPLIEVLPECAKPPVSGSSTIEEIDDTEKFKLIAIPKNGPAKTLIAFISMFALSGKDLELDVGSDRVIIRSPKNNQIVDFYIPIKVNRDKVTAKYLVNAQTLRIEMPVKI